MDASENRIVLRHGQAELAYSVPASAVTMIARKACDLARFEIGTQVTVRYRVASAEPHTVYDLVDHSTWSWLVRMRREISGGVVREVTDRGVVFEDATDHGQMFFRVTDKTRIEAGDAHSLGDLKPDMTVFIAPRLLPNGQTMATAIADTREGAERLRERTMPTVTGTIRSVDGMRRSMEMDTRAGDRRELRLGDPCVVRRDGKDVAISQLRVGQWVTAHVRRVEDVERVYRITISKRPSSPSAKTTKPAVRRR